MDGELFGTTINSLTSVSLDPCMLQFCTNEGSSTGMAIRQGGLFSVNIPGQHQSDLSHRYTGRLKSRFEDLALAFSADGLPLLQGAAARLCCRIVTIHKGGDHDVILGVVLSGEESACSPLSFTRAATEAFSALEVRRLHERPRLPREPARRATG